MLTASTILHKPIIFFPQNHKCKFTKPPITFSVSSSIQKIDEHISSVPENPIGRTKTKERVFFLDVNPICYKGNTPSLHSFAHWISLFLSEVSLHHPVIAVISSLFFPFLLVKYWIVLILKWYDCLFYLICFSILVCGGFPVSYFYSSM